VARRIAADPTGTWRRLVTDEIGRLVDYGRTTYRPPADLAQYVIARDRTFPRRLRLHWRGDPHCAPGCNQPAAKADLHHIRPWSQGGQTNAEDLASACQHDHYSVHEAGWQTRRLQDGTVEWTSPTGHTYRVPLATYPVDTTCQRPYTRPGRRAEGDRPNRTGLGLNRRHSAAGGHGEALATCPALPQAPSRLPARFRPGGPVLVAGQGEDQTDHGDQLGGR
jgi:hypothetical protein